MNTQFKVKVDEVGKKRLLFYRLKNMNNSRKIFMI